MGEQPVTMANNAFRYASGTGTATVDVPSGARLQRIAVVPGASEATITIGGGDTIHVPSGSAFDELVSGDAFGQDVAIGGTVDTWFISWKEVA